MIKGNYEYYVSLEIAKLLKKAGFNCEEYYPRNFCYVNDNPELFDKSVLKNYIEEDDVIYLAPTLGVAQRWLREVKNISVEIISTRYNHWEYIIRKINQVNRNDNIILALTACRFYTYEEALEAGIKKSLELILEKGK